MNGIAIIKELIIGKNGIGLFEVLEDNSRYFHFSSNSGEFTIDGFDSTITIVSHKKSETYFLHEIQRLEYGTMRKQIPPDPKPGPRKTFWVIIVELLSIVLGFIWYDLGRIVSTLNAGYPGAEAKWFQISAILHNGIRIPLYLAMHAKILGDDQLEIVFQVRDAFERHGSSLPLGKVERVAEGEIPQIVKQLHIKPII